jgi:DNA-binding MarR family transcriptional regulator
VADDTGSTDAARLWSALVDVYQPVLRAVVTTLERDAGIDSGVYSALAYLDRAEGRMRIGELHELMQVRYSQPGLSRLVQRMESDGLLARAIDPRDRRATVLTVTRTGRTRFRKAHAVYQDALEEHLGSFVRANEARALAEVLEHLAEARQGWVRKQRARRGS